MKIRQEADGSITVKCGEQEINIFADGFTSAEGSKSLGESDSPTKPVIIEPPQPIPEKPPATTPELPERPIKTKPTHVAYRIKIFGGVAPFTSGVVVKTRAGAMREYEVTELLETQARAADGSVTYLFIGASSPLPAERLTELQAAIARGYLEPTRR